MMCCMTSVYIVAVRAIIATGMLFASSSSANVVQHDPPSDVSIQLQGEIELQRLVDLAAKRLNLTIEYDAAVLKGKATLRLTDSLTDEQLWELTNRVLGLRGFTTVRLPRDDGENILSVVRLADAPGLTATSRQGELSDHAGFVAVVHRVEHLSSKDAVDSLKPVLSKSGGTVTALGESDLILIADLRPRVEEALTLLAELDQPGHGTVVERIETRHLPASRLAAVLTSVVAARDLVEGRSVAGKVIAEVGDQAVILIAPPAEAEKWRELIARFDRLPPVETHTYAPRYFGLDEVAALIEQTIKPSNSDGEQWRLVRDELTGSIILTAGVEQHQQVQSLIDRLNSVPTEARRPVRTFQVRNRPVAQVIDVLNRLMSIGAIEEAAASASTAPSQRSPTESGSPRLVPGTGPSGTAEPTDRTRSSRERGQADVRSSTGEAESQLKLTADEATSTIIAMGEPRLLDQVQRLIAQLDVRQPQVMIEILIVSLTDSQTLDLGIELEKLEVSGDVRISLSSLFGLSSVSDGLRSVGNARGGSALVLSPGDFSVVIRALETLNDGRSLNVPRMLVNNNQQASLNSVLQQPFVSINAFDTLATTSFGGTQDAGTVVTVKPQIARGDHLILDYSVTLSAFVGESTDPSLPPPRQENRLQSVATIPDGYVVALGGIEVTNHSKGVSQVPGLGGLPIIGELFKNRSRTESRNRFYIFIRPSVLRRLDFEDLRYLSEAPMAASSIEDGWPEVEPQVIR